MTEKLPDPSSPKWNSVTKIIAGFSLVAAIGGLLIHFQYILPQILLLIIVAYLVNPIANFIRSVTRLPWKASVAIVFLLMVGTYVSLITWSGFSVVKQTLNLVELMRTGMNQVPDLYRNFISVPLVIGPFQFDLSSLNIAAYDQQIIESSQTLVRIIADGLAKFASGMANFIGWSFIIFLGAFFVLFEENELWKGIFDVRIPGYEKDVKEFRDHLFHIWNSFFRGQITVMLIATAVYIVVLSALNVKYALGIAIIAGLVRFVPYVGPFFFWVILIIVTLFQENTAFGMDKATYIIVVVVISYLIDWVMDYIINPRIMSTALKIHPVLILIGVIVGYGLLGILGVLIAAPLVATILFIMRYIYRKLMDLDPWDGIETVPEGGQTEKKPLFNTEKIKALFARIKFKK